MTSLPIESSRLQRQIDELASISEAPPPVVARVLFSEADLRARAFIKKLCTELDLSIREDAVGNIFARWHGSDSTLPAVATGSHIDAIPNAGRFDGVVGVLGAIEAIRALKQTGFKPRRGIELIIFTAEEPTRFGIGCLGSRLLAGTLSSERIAALRDRDGHDLNYWRAKARLTGSSEPPPGFGLRQSSGAFETALYSKRFDPRQNPQRASRDLPLPEGEGRGEGKENVQEPSAEQSPGDILAHSVRLPKNFYSAFIELHIEQGPILERENIPIGIVERIAAPSTLRIQLTGVGGHAGAVLMPERHDALLAGAEIALAVEKAALTSGSPDTVATTGVFRIEPGAVNSVPCRAWLEIDLRDTQVATRDAALKRIESSMPEICNRRGIQFQIERLNVDAPAVSDPNLVNTVGAVCEKLRLRSKKMISRAYHDSLFMAQICPTTMIFIPCRDGVSHRPDEYSSPDQIKAGVQVLAGTLARLSGIPAAEVTRL